MPGDDPVLAATTTTVVGYKLELHFAGTMPFMFPQSRRLSSMDANAPNLISCFDALKIHEEELERSVSMAIHLIPAHGIF